MKKIILMLKVITISVLCSVVMMLLHKVTILEDIETPQLSWLSNQYGAETAAFLWGIAAYCVISGVYIVAEKYLKGSKGNRALLFGGLTGGTWLFGMIEIDQTINNLIMGLVDGVMVVVVCILIAMLVIPKHEIVDKPDVARDNYKSGIIEVGIVATIFAIYRLCFGVFLGKYYDSTFDYIMIPIYSSFMGFMWIKLKNMAGSGTCFKKAFQYSAIIWGMPSCIFMYFLAFLFANMFVGMTIRNIFDIVFMTLSVWLAMKFNLTQKMKN